MRALVTGADGFVGRHLVAALRSRGDVVAAMGGPGPGGQDILDGAAVSSLVADSRPEAIIHLAGVSSVAQSHHHPSATMSVNVVGTTNLLDAVRSHAAKARVLLIGSGEVYGKLAQGHRAMEADRPAPLSPYASSKVAVEVIGQQMALAHGLDVVFTRSFNHIGSGQSLGFVMPSLALQLNRIARGQGPPVIEVGDLSPVRDFSHVLDVVDAYLLLLEKGAQGTIYNVCSGEGLSIQGALDLLQRLAGTRAEVHVDPSRIRPVEIPWLVGDPSRLEHLGWAHHRTLAQALKDVLSSAGEPSFAQGSESSSTP